MTWNGEIYISFFSISIYQALVHAIFYIRCLVHTNEDNIFLGIRSKSLLAI